MNFRRHTRLLSAAVVCASFLALGCGEERFDLPPAAESVVTQERLGEMNDLGLAVYDGFQPPNATGSFAWNDTTWVVAPRPENQGRSVCSGILTLDRERTTVYAYQRQFSGEECVGGGSGSDIPVSGDGSCFSVFLRTTETVGTCESSQVEVMSGCLAEYGIEGFESGWYVEEYHSAPCSDLVESGQMPPAGEVVIQREGDGLAERQ
jgi:hypothetical protein